MHKDFQLIVRKLLQLTQLADPITQDLLPGQYDDPDAAAAELLRKINFSFLILLAGEEHPAYQGAKEVLESRSQTDGWDEIARFYLTAKHAIEQEIDSLRQAAPAAAQHLESLAEQLSELDNPLMDDQRVELLWSFTHPEATGIWNHADQRRAELREKRQVTITDLNPTPLQNPARQVLFTANALLTLPPNSKPLSQLSLSKDLQAQLSRVMAEPQVYWYDHPIQIGVEPYKNEVLYGLQGLQEALDFEIAHGSSQGGDQLTCLLSVSVTHDGLHDLARQYLAEALQANQPLPGIKVVMLTESNSRKLIDEILAPAAEHYLGVENASEQLNVLGVDGEYGRHYSFLKAMAALWQVLVEPQIKATFKIDLDQVFPQEQLLRETGLSAFQHFKTPLWGARGLDAQAHPVELGMIAGALVNEDDIGQCLFTPDVPFPHQERELTLDERVFFSQLPQALSTQAEMMARYDSPQLDGINTCLQRVHVTGGTNGILVDSLRRFQPFTPSFIGRAEDQAYILSTFPEPGARLAYLHQPGLIMRHDKQAFAQEAIHSAQVGKLIGDYVRILYFSAYARSLELDLGEVKDRMDPFTGSFISWIPNTLTLLRFALKAEALFQAGEEQLAVDFLHLGTQRIDQAMRFTTQALAGQYQQEHQGWALYYDTLSALEKGLQAGDPFAEELRRKTQDLIQGCVISGSENAELFS